jgi:pimeloyl-ACP methyl ester carboxylesterase
MSDPDVSERQTGCKPKLTLLLLPGMDGTGELFSDFVKHLPAWIDPKVVRYPRHDYYSFADLSAAARSAIPPSEPFVLLAESFSTPIAVRVAADRPANLLALIVCAGFVQPPIGGIFGRSLSALAPAFFRLPLPAFAVRALLVGRGAPSGLVNQVKTTISSVRPKVLSLRLRRLLSCDETASLAKLQVPMLYLQATDDRLIDKYSFEVVRGAKPDAILQRIPGPHFLLQRKPQAAVDAILAFIESLI